MSKRTDREFLDDLREANHRITVYVSGMTYDSFVADVKTQDAVIRNLEILGEATRNLSDPLRATHPAIPWKSMAGARDRLIRDYFGVNLDIVWEIAALELPKLAPQIETLIKETE